MARVYQQPRWTISNYVSVSTLLLELVALGPLAKVGEEGDTSAEFEPVLE